MSKLGATVYYRPTPLDGFTGHQEGLCAGMVAADIGEDRVNLVVFSGDANFYSRRGVQLVEGPVGEGQCTLRSAADIPLAQIVEKINGHSETLERLISNQEQATDVLAGVTNRVVDIEETINRLTFEVKDRPPGPIAPEPSQGTTRDVHPDAVESRDSTEANDRPAATSDAKGESSQAATA